MARIVFMGTPEFAVPSLVALIQHHEVVGVVTQPDRPVGRKGEVNPTPVKQIALDHNIPYIQPEKLRGQEVKTWLAEREAELFVVAAFGQILPQSVLDIPSRACINVHGSLLPRWRGAAPIHAAIRAGDSETGITIMLMDAGLDTGAMLTKAALPILPTDTGASLHDKMAQLGADLLIETLPRYLNGDITPEPQDDALATFASQIEKHEGQLNWQQPAIALERQIRAYTPWPGTFTHWEGKQLKIHTAQVVDSNAPSGQVILKGNQVLVGTGDGLLELLDVQLEGKKRVSVADFVRGYPHFVGSTLV